MEMAELRRKAIPYYACYISRLFNTPGSTHTINEIHLASAVDTGDPADRGFYLNDLDLIERAIEYLETAHVVRTITDEFAPRIVIQHPNFFENLSNLRSQEDTVFGRYALAGEGRVTWLLQALSKIKTQLEEGKEEEGEKRRKNGLSDTDSWEPIPLDRNDPSQELATKALDRIIEELRGDNGYATEHPEEKAFVQDKLFAVSKRFKEQTQISWMYLREFAFVPLTMLMKRFGGAAIGVAAATCKDVLTSWLKSKGISFLDDVLK
jgi:hypothetical protein